MFKRYTILALTLTLLFSPFVSRASAAQTYVYHGSNTLAVAYFQSTADGIVTQVALSASDSEFRALPDHPQGGSSSVAMVDILQYREGCPPWQEGCATLLYAQGYTDQAQFDASRKLTTASLQGTITATDHVSGRTLPIVIDVVLTGSGETLRNQGAHRFREGGFITTITGIDLRRRAEVAGSMLVDGVEMAGAATYAELERASGNNVYVELGY